MVSRVASLASRTTGVEEAREERGQEDSGYERVGSMPRASKAAFGREVIFQEPGEGVVPSFFLAV